VKAAADLLAVFKGPQADAAAGNRPGY